MADRRAHARRQPSRHAADLRADVLGHVFVKIFQHVIADVVAVLRAEPGDGIGIADLFHALGEQQHAGAHAVNQPSAAFRQMLHDRRRHVGEQGHRDFALADFTPLVDIGAWRASGASFGNVTDHGIEVHVVAVELLRQWRRPCRLLRLDRLFQALQRVGILLHQAVGLPHVRFGQPLLLHPAPVALVARLAVIPFRIGNALVTAALTGGVLVALARSAR